MATHVTLHPGRGSYNGLRKGDGASHSSVNRRSINNDNAITSESLYSDDDYFASIEQYKNESWYDKLLENPWLWSKQGEFSPTLLQQLAEGFGDTSARDNYINQIQSNRAQWLTDTLAQYHQQDYESAPNQAQLTKQAGLNPDLAGLAESPAAENDQPINQNPAIDRNTDLQTIWNIGSSLLGSVFSVVGSLQGLESNHLDNRLKSIDLSKGFSAWGKDLISDSITEYWNGLDDTASIENVFKDGSWIDSLTSKLSNKLDSMPISHKDRRRMRSIIDDLVYTKDSDGTKSYSAWFETAVNDAVSNLRESRNKRAKSSALPGATMGDTKALDFLATEVYQPIINAELKVQELQLKYNKEYLSTDGLGREKGISEKASYKLRQDMLDVKDDLLKAFQEINKKITGSKDISPIWKLALQAGISSAESFALSRLGFGNF